MPILALDALRRAPDAATVLVACVVRPPPAPVRADDCPDVRHADLRTLAALLDELAAGASDRICAYRATVGPEELLGDRLAGLIEWILWRESTPPSRVVAPFAFGRVGADADAPRAVDAGELRVILSRALRAAPPEVRTLPFGVQATPAALVIARCLGALALATPGAVSAGGRWPGVREPADAEVGMKDAELLEPQLAPTLRASDVAGLPNFLAYVRSANEAANVPFSIRTRPPSTAARDGELGNMIRELSRYKFGRKRELVDAEIHAGLETLRGDE